ncbi:uncharacterized protein LOC141904544 [Tubulanus polymorphus]|uniref:uncharacterized protein LOC141904544 n=1 Tax=Tubulanus polymorphus TaxID=672921 RepID=UPI003DA2919F
MSRFVGRTYSRVNRDKSVAAGKNFDDIINAKDSSNKASNMPRTSTAMQKWGVTSFTSVRAGKSLISEDESIDVKRRRMEADVFGDPFSFDDDDPQSPVKGKKVPKVKLKKASLLKQNSAPTSRGKRSGVGGASSVKSSTTNTAKNNAKNSNQTSLKFTYSRVNKTLSQSATTEPVPNLTRASSAPGVFKTPAKTSRASKNSKKSSDNQQLTMDSFTSANEESTAAGSRPTLKITPSSGDRSDSSDDCVPIWKRGLNSKQAIVSADTDKQLSSDDLWDSIIGLGAKKESKKPSSNWSLAPAETWLGSSPDHTYFRSPKKDDCNDFTSDRPKPAFSDNDSDMDTDALLPTTESSQDSRNDDSAYSSSRDVAAFTSSQSTRGSGGVNSNDVSKPTTSRKSNELLARIHGKNGRVTNIKNSAAAAAANSDSDSDREGGKKKGKISVSHLLPLTSKEREAKELSEIRKNTSSTAAEPTTSVKTQKTIFTSKQRRLITSPSKSPAKRYNVRQWQSTSPEMEAIASEGTSKNRGSSGSTSTNVCSSEMSKLALDFPDDTNTQISNTKITRRQKDARRPWDQTQTVTALHVPKDAKQLYTVVKNVKEAHECQEHGETQEFFDDIEYLLAGLDATHSFTTRCLSTLSFANKCLMPAFRMHLRAHGTVTKIFGALLNASENPSLALSTAAIMYMMSRDRMNMDVDVHTLELMINLLSLDIKKSDKLNRNVCKDYERMKQKVTLVIEQLKKDGGAKSIELSEISTGNLAMETLLSLTSRRAGDWFKDEMRHLGGLEHIVDTVSECSDELDENSLEITTVTIEHLKKIERCLRVLEHVTYLNSDNQMFLISYNTSVLVNCLCMLLKLCIRLLAFNSINTDLESSNKPSPVRTVLDCLMAVLKVLLNITHDNEWGSAKVGSLDGILAIVLRCTQTVSESLPHDEQFDLLVLSLGLLINLTEHNEANRRMLVNTSILLDPLAPTPTDEDDEPNTVGALQLLTSLFNQKEQAASQLEDSVSKPSAGAAMSADGGAATAAADESGEWQESDSGLLWVIGKKKKGANGGEDDDSDDENHIEIIPSSQEENENFTKALHKAGKHMEDSIVAAYAALLLGCIVQDNRMLVDRVRKHLPDGSFAPMVKILIKFLGFINLTSAVSQAGTKSIAKVIETLESL